MASLTVDSRDPIELPVHAASVGPDVIDVSGLTSQGYFTYDPGFVSTASCNSNITYIDGDEGILLHCGYPIEQLAEHSDFLELCYLLLNSELPSARREDRLPRGHQASRRGGRATPQFLHGISARRASHGDDVRRRRGAGGVLPQLLGHHGRIPPAGHGPSPHREDAHPGGHDLQAHAGTAVHSTAGRPRLRGKLSAHDVRAGRRRLRGQPGPRARLRPHLPAACRSRAERVDIDGAPRRLHRGQSLRLYRRGIAALWDLPTAAPTKRCSTCLRRSGRRGISTGS